MSLRGAERPSVHEDEHDLLRLQQQFHQTQGINSGSTSVKAAGKPIRVPALKPTVVRPAEILLDMDSQSSSHRPGLTRVDIDSKPKPSIFAAHLARGRENNSTTGSSSSRRMQTADVLLGQVLTDVVERSPSIVTPVLKSQGPPSGFPTPLHRTERWNETAERPKTFTPTASLMDVFANGSISHNEQDIHAENVKVVSKMAPEEIEEAQAEILSKLNPSIVQMLKERAGRKYAREKRIENGEVNSQESSTSHVSQAPSSAGEPSRPFHTESWIPPEKLEEEKLQWMSPVHEYGEVSEEEKDAADLRFDLSGNLVDRNANVPVHLGLHHHSSSPSKAGYSIDELLHLSRSTVPSQRAVSIRVLGFILAKFYGDTYGRGRCIALVALLMRKNLLLHLRLALDDTHETVLMNTLGALAAALGVGSFTQNAEETLWDDFFLTRFGHRAYATSIDNQEFFRVRSTGLGHLFEPPENDGTMESAVHLIRRDAVLGLLSTNILTRFSYLLRSRDLALDAVNDIIRILIRVARHSRATAYQVIECEGLIAGVRDRLFRMPWPAPSGLQLLPSLGFKLVRVLCQASREVSQKLANFGIADEVLRFISVNIYDLPESFHEAGYGLQSEVWAVFRILFGYGLSGSVFDDYRQILYDKARQLYVKRGDALAKPYIVKCRASFTRMLITLTQSFGPLLDVGGTNDALWPFLELLLSSPSSCPHNSLTEWDHYGAVLNFMTEYARLIQLNTPAKCSMVADQLMQYMRRPYGWYQSSTAASVRAMVGGIRQRRRQSSESVAPLFGWHLAGLQTEARTSLAGMLVVFTVHCDRYSSFLDLLSWLAGSKEEYVSVLSDYLTSVETQSMLEAALEEIEDCYTHTDWVRFFAQGKTALAYSWLSAVDVMQQLGKDSIELPRVAAVALATLAGLLPGDEYIASRLLNKYILHHNIQLGLQGVDEVPALDAQLSQRIQEIFDYDMYSDVTLLASKGLYQGQSEHLHSMLMEGNKRSISLPVRRDWMFAIFEKLHAESQQFADTLTDSMPLPGIGREGAAEIVAECLRLIKRLESAVTPRWWSSRVPCAARVVRLMNIFLLPPTSQGELFAQPDVNGLLQEALTRYCAVPDAQFARHMEESVGGDARFQEFYRELLEQYTAVSFGDAVFGSFLMLPLAMGFPSDCREAFWTHCMDLLGSFAVRTTEVPAPNGALDYFNYQESNERVLLLYFQALHEERVSRKSTPFLYAVAVNQLSQVWNGANGVSPIAPDFKNRLITMISEGLNPSISESIKHGWSLDSS
ncbi:hypothetical protein BC832DRAFT_592003 [Gaertneriomyces semiglobifer]|nr:hypothetical protein BC832DRAFT_592003 [Gaertneriomyces semiglobifer]